MNAERLADFAHVVQGEMNFPRIAGDVDRESAERKKSVTFRASDVVSRGEIDGEGSGRIAECRNIAALGMKRDARLPDPRAVLVRHASGDRRSASVENDRKHGCRERDTP